MNFLLTLYINKYSILFAFWNVFLALTPCVIIYYLAQSKDLKYWKKMKWAGRIVFVILFLFWLFFLPNTAYLFTMVRHIVNYCGDFDKYRVCTQGAWIPIFFFVYALIGLPTFYYAMNKMSEVLKNVFYKKCKWVFPIVFIPITSIGVMLGLFQRFNSWEILTKPWYILEVAGYYLTHSPYINFFIVFTIVLYLIYYVTDFFIWKIQK